MEKITMSNLVSGNSDRSEFAAEYCKTSLRLGEKCGICEDRDPRNIVFFPSELSDHAHKNCLQIFEQATNSKNYFSSIGKKDQSTVNTATKEAVTLMRNKISPRNMKEYLDTEMNKESGKNIKELFNQCVREMEANHKK